MPEQSARTLRLQLGDGRSLPVPMSNGFFLCVFLYPVPQSRWTKGRRPAFLVGRTKDDRVGRRLLYEYTLAP